jgi:L-serine kinase (ATP) / ParB family transcriptional regulator, heme-responsive regulator
MSNYSISAPPPDLQIVEIDNVLPHEKNDIQRSQPLIERIRDAPFFTNPPVVASIPDNRFVLMDGANRHNSLKHLGFKHILVQVADYNTEFIELGVWQHIVSDWESNHFVQQLERIDGIEIRGGWDSKAVAQVLLREGPVYGIHAKIDSIIERNFTLCQVVETYHHNATLYRTPLTDPTQIWSLYPSAVALVMFPTYEPQNIIDAATNQAYLPPGVSRHIIHGRALKLNYPMEKLREDLPLEQKNKDLQQWVRAKFANRSIRYYAEATYQFDE